jgi:hypothetical protein
MSGQPRCRDSTNPAAIWKSMLTRCGNGLAPVCRGITAMALQMLVQSGGLSLEIWSSGEYRGCRFSELSSARSSTPATLIVSLQESQQWWRWCAHAGFCAALGTQPLSTQASCPEQHHDLAFAAQIRDWRACSTRLGITPKAAFSRSTLCAHMTCLNALKSN